jgi:hypothetical protein
VDFFGATRVIKPSAGQLSSATEVGRAAARGDFRQTAAIQQRAAYLLSDVAHRLAFKKNLKNRTARCRGRVSNTP